MKTTIGPITKLFPMPTLLLSVATGDGAANVMTVVWAGLIGSGPVMIAVRIGGFHHSAAFINKEMSFALNVPRSSQVALVDYCGTVSGADDPNKAGTCGFTFAPSLHISSPIIAECPVNFECRVLERIPAGKGAIYLAEVLETHVDKDVLEASGKIAATLLDPIIYGTDGKYYKLGECLGAERATATPRV